MFFFFFIIHNTLTTLVEIAYFFIQQCVKSCLVIKLALNYIIFFSIKTFICAYFTMFVKMGGERMLMFLSRTAIIGEICILNTEAVSDLYL